MANFPPGYIATIREALTTFHTEAGKFAQANGCVPAAGSHAATEQTSCARPESIVTAMSLGVQLIEFGAEHLTAFVKIITDPVEVIACWTCVRSMLESCSLSAWLLDPTITPTTRIGRVYAIRYDSMEQQVKFGRAAGIPQPEIAGLEERINAVEREAIALGYPPVVDRNNRRIGIAQQVPSATDMIQLMLDEGTTYRLLSGVAHGHSWAILGLGYKPSGPDKNIGGVTAKPYQKTDDITGIAYLGIRTAKALARPLWNQCRYFGWNALALEEIFENVFGKLDATTTLRFWRSP